MNRTFLYSYDDAGNILSKIGYEFSPNILTSDLPAEGTKMNRIFTYGSDGRLSKFRGDINYDEIGNPDSYQRTELEWQNGRHLARFGTYTYTYNADGLRTSKSNNGTLTNEYILNGSQVMRQLIYADGVTYVADYIYHENGTPIAFAYYQENGTPVYYFYETNIQGDIVNVYNENGVRVLGHRYDAYGITSTDKYNTTICTDTFLQAVLFAYRGYIYDSETALYYLQSRYYAPDICRFLNADNSDVITASPMALTDKNLYAYCDNNPVMRVDEDGEFWLTAALIGAGIGIAIQYIGDVIDNLENEKTGADIFTPVSSVRDYIAAGVGGFLAAIPGANLVSTMAIGAVGNIAADVIKGDISNVEDFLVSGVSGAIFNGFGYKVGKGLATRKASKIMSMDRMSRKRYVLDKMSNLTHRDINAVYQTFIDNPIGMVENSFGVFRNGVYSSLASTAYGKWWEQRCDV